jgi:group I intron endonuclease
MIYRSGIYIIRHGFSGRYYIGSSKHIERRLKEHRRLLQQGKHHCRRLQAAWVKFGAGAFGFGVVEDTSLCDLLSREQFWLDALKAYQRDKQAKFAKEVEGSQERFDVWLKQTRESHDRARLELLQRIATDKRHRERY